MVSRQDYTWPMVKHSDAYPYKHSSKASRKHFAIFFYVYSLGLEIFVLSVKLLMLKDRLWLSQSSCNFLTEELYTKILFDVIFNNMYIVP